MSAEQKSWMLFEDSSLRQQRLKSREKELIKQDLNECKWKYMSSKSAKLVEKKFIKDFNNVLIDLNISPKPNSQIDFEKFVDFIAIFIYKSKDKSSFLSESEEVRELWNILKGNSFGYTLKHSL